jgi:stage II sporulation protein AA (anti-sigma F factor antagonist)
MVERTRGLTFKVSDVKAGGDERTIKLLDCTGEIDTDTYQKFDAQVFGLIDEGTDRLILGLERTPVINSMGVGVIVRAYKKLKELGGGLVLLNPSSGIRQVLFTLMLEKKLSITATVDDAVKLLSSGA